MRAVTTEMKEEMNGPGEFFIDRIKFMGSKNKYFLLKSIKKRKNILLVFYPQHYKKEYIVRYDISLHLTVFTEARLIINECH